MLIQVSYSNQQERFSHFNVFRNSFLITLKFSCYIRNSLNPQHDTLINCTVLQNILRINPQAKQKTLKKLRAANVSHNTNQCMEVKISVSFPKSN